MGPKLEPLLLRGCKRAAMAMYPMTDLQYQAVYNVLSFALASMMATTLTYGSGCLQ